MPVTLHDVLTRSLLRELAGARIFNRGLEYFKYGLAHDLVYAEMGTEVSAQVAGTEEYDVELWEENGSVEWYCSCPFAEKGNFCKHLVALGLEVLAEPAAPDEQPTHRESRGKAAKKLRSSESGEIAQARTLINQIVAGATYGAGSPAMIVDLLEVLRKIRETEGPAEALKYADLFWDRTAHNVRFPKNVEPLIPDVRDLHQSLVAELRIEPAALAERLLQIELLQGHHYFKDSARHYADVLGKKGLAAFRSLLSHQIQQLDVLEPTGIYYSINYGDYETVQGVARRFADFQNDPRIYIAALSRDQRHASYLARLSKVCREAGFMKEALRWAKHSCKHFPYAAEGYEALAECLIAQGQPEAATIALFEQFSENPGLANYRMLRKYATRSGHWETYVDRSLHKLRDASLRFGWSADYIDACLLESRPLEALEFVEAIEETDSWCDPDALRRLGRAIEPDYPDEAVELYLDQIDALVEETQASSYAEATRWLERALNVLKKQRDSGTIKIVVTDLRERFKRKKGFTSRLGDMINRLGLQELVDPRKALNDE